MIQMFTVGLNFRVLFLITFFILYIHEIHIQKLLLKYQIHIQSEIQIYTNKTEYFTSNKHSSKYMMKKILVNLLVQKETVS